MKRNLLLALFGCLLAVTASADLSGAWTASVDGAREGQIYLDLTRGPGHAHGHHYFAADLRGLTREQIQAAERTDVQFELRRESGTISFEGSFRKGRGAGQFTFAPSKSYAGELRKLNLNLDDFDDDDSESDRLFFLTTLDVSTQYIRDMRAEGFGGNFDDFVQMRMFGVSKEYIREMRTLGYKGLSQEKIVEASLHGVTADYVRKTRAYGWNLSLEKLVETRIHGATPEFAEQMKKAGYPSLPQEKLVELRIFGVTPQFIRELAEAGYEKIPVDKLVEMKMHGIDATFIRKMSKVKR